MNTTIGRRRFGWAARVSILSATLAIVAAPAADAASGKFVISGNPATVTVGTTYNLNAPIGTSDMYDTPTVNFYDNGKCVGSTYVVPTGNEAPRFTRMPWVPSTAGTHTLLAKSGQFTTEKIVVTVVAAPAGSTPDPQPANEACKGNSLDTGSLNSGSVDLGSVDTSIFTALLFPGSAG